jgi:hypothetical protein
VEEARLASGLEGISETSRTGGVSAAGVETRRGAAAGVEVLVEVQSVSDRTYA